MASCIICFTIYSAEDTVILLNCHHCYHKRCIENWTKVRSECPQCRKKVQYSKSTRIFLNFTGQMDEEKTEQPNLMLCRVVKAQTRKIKDLELLITDKKLEIMNLHRLLQESREQIDIFQRLLNARIEENMELKRIIDELHIQNVTYFTNFFKFRSKYDEVVQVIMERVCDVKKLLLGEDLEKNLNINTVKNIIESLDELLYMINLVQSNEQEIRDSVRESLFHK